MSLAYLAFAVVVVIVAFVINRIQAGQVAKAQEAQAVAEFSAKRFEDNLTFWQAQATNRNTQVRELQATITGLRQSLQSKDNSLEDQVRQISERDLRLANQARALERAEHTITQTYEVKLEQANERARKELQRANELDEQLGKEEKRYLALYGAVVKHRDAKGHDRCWLNDKELYVAAGLDVQDPELPPLPEFISRCGEYWQGQSKTIAPVPRPFTQEKAEELIALLSQETLSDTEVARLSALHCEVTRFNDGRWILSSITYPGIVGVSEEGERELGGRLQEAYRKASDLSKFGPVTESVLVPVNSSPEI